MIFFSTKKVEYHYLLACMPEDEVVEEAEEGEGRGARHEALGHHVVVQAEGGAQAQGRRLALQDFRRGTWVNAVNRHLLVTL